MEINNEDPRLQAYPKRDMVCFPSAFRTKNSLNITHATLDGEKTLCGRKDWITTEGWSKWGPDCLRCVKALEKNIKGT